MDGYNSWKIIFVTPNNASEYHLSGKMQNIVKYFIFSVLCLLPLKVMGGDTDHWETILEKGSNCRYFVPDAAVDPQWRARDFDDSSWDTGPGGVGFGDDDDPTMIDPAISAYCRYHFELTDPEVISGLILDVDFDDGFVAYLNGMELGRFNMGEPGSATSWDQAADDVYEAPLIRGMSPYRVPLPDAIELQLVTGENILAIEVHNRTATSSDLSSNVFLHAGISTPDHYFLQTPDWFYRPFHEDSTLLPLMVIDTEGQEIPDEPRIKARMGLIHQDYGRYNSIGDPFNGYDGQISIELRGESSIWYYPKMSYRIETQTESGSNNNVSLLGLPAENDFVLYGPYGDKSLIRNVITYRLFEQFGHYSPRTRFVELVINGDHKGVYVLTEKIKRDKNRVNMAKITPEDVTLSDMSGGYLLRVDKTSALAPEEFWESPYPSPVPDHHPVIFQYYDPAYDELTPDQRDYIRNYLAEFEQMLVSQDFSNPGNGYRSFLDISSFTDLMILNEFVKDVDGFEFSHYFYKQKDTNGGKLVNGPPWDYNLTFGNSNFTPDVHLTDNWTHTLSNTIWWWARVMQDPWFRNQVYCRWDELYTSVLSQENVGNLIDSTILVLGDAITRNYQRWPILYLEVWPNSFIGQNYAEEEAFLRTWISDRLTWMDSKWGGLCIPASSGSEDLIRKPGTLKTYPNPSDLSNTYVSVGFSSSVELSFRLFDLNGRVVFHSNATYSGDEFAYALPDLSFLPDGIYTLEVSDGHGIREMCKLIKQQ
jgi:hypothetical protein